MIYEQQLVYLIRLTKTDIRLDCFLSLKLRTYICKTQNVHLEDLHPKLTQLIFTEFALSRSLAASI